MTTEVPTTIEGAAAVEQGDVRAAGEPRISELLAGFRANLPDGRVSLAQALDVLGERAFGAVMLVLSLPNALPVPLGVATVLEIPMLLVSIQMTMGRKRLWLPGFALRLSLPAEKAGRLLDRMVSLLRRMERLVRPRLGALRGPAVERPIGLLCVVLGIILVVPVPLLGWFPAFALVALSLGLVERDGVMLLVGLGLAALSLATTAAVLVGVASAGEFLAGSLPFPIPFVGE